MAILRGVPSDILHDVTAKIADSECLKLPKMTHKNTPKTFFFQRATIRSQLIFLNFVFIPGFPGQIYNPEGLRGCCYRVDVLSRTQVGALPNTVEESWGDLRF